MTPRRGSSSTDLLDSWGRVAARIAAAPGVCILTDFDGTLVPLARRPQAAVAPKAAVRLLEALSHYPEAVVGLVSGRALQDLIPRIGLERLWYVGCHGFEIRTPAGEERHNFTSQDSRYVDSVASEVGREIGRVAGVALERKGPILAVHYRNVSLPEVSRVQRAVLRILHRHEEQLSLSPGNQLLELRLRRPCTKGLAVREIRRGLPPGCLSFYFGDDAPDREVFRELRPDGISVEVGASSTRRADFSLEHPDAVIETLRRIERLLKWRRRRARRPGERGRGIRRPARGEPQP